MIPSECINLSVNYFDDAKTKRLVGLLGRGAEIMPIRLLCYCGKHHAENGRLTGYSVKEIEAICGWWGKDGAAVETLVGSAIEFLGLDGTTYFIRKWTEWQGHIHAIKTKAARNAEIRWGKKRKPPDANSDASSTPSSNALVCTDLSPLRPPAGGRGESKSAARRRQQRERIMGASK